MSIARIIYDVGSWTDRNHAERITGQAPPDFDVAPTAIAEASPIESALSGPAADVVLVLPSADVLAVRGAIEARGWRSKVVGVWSAGLPQRMASFQRVYDLADAWVISNQDYWEGLGRLSATFVVPFGVDLDVFRVTRPIDSRSHKVLWVGSRTRRGIEGYDRLIEPLAHKLHLQGIELETRLLDSDDGCEFSAAERAAWYNQGTVFVCASHAEATPAAALEAAACGCTLVSTPVGNLPQLIRNDSNGYLVARSLAALHAGVMRAQENHLSLAPQMQRDIRAFDWRAIGSQFYDVLRSALDPPAPAAKPDLRDQVTAFVSTVGASSFPICLRRLEQQDCQLRVEVIENVAPMSAAFQRMLDHCQTPFFVQVDEDMLLYPNAIRALHEKISTAPDDVAMYCADLYDAHLARCIQGVKIFRHAVAQRYPFESQDSFEVSQLRRMRADGYIYHASATTGRVPQHDRTLGLHGVEWTDTSIYERYFTLMRRRAARPQRMHWLDEYPAIFLQRFLEEPSEENLFALQGMIAGVLTSAAGEAGAKDYRNYNALPGFAAIEEFLRQLTSPPAKRG